MQINLCVNCMEEMEGDVCPHCGYRREQEKPEPSVLEWYTILHGRYLLGKVLGRGGFGITYIGFDLPLNTKVAVKEYFPSEYASRDCTYSSNIQWSNSRMGQERWKTGCEDFLKEARRMAKIDAIPEIVRVRDTFTENNTAYIVMDYAEGATLKDTIAGKGPMKVKDCLNMMTPLVNGLEQMHKKGMIHRDISPNNVMVLPDGNVRLLDFGAAKDFTVGTGENSQLVVTRGFSPAEQYVKGGRIGPWTDVYALSATIYYAVTGIRPPDSLERMLQDTLELKPDKKTGLTAKVLSVLKAGMALKSEQRIQTVGELLSRLQKAVFGQRKPTKSAVAVGLGLFGVLAVIAVSTLWYVFSKPKVKTWTENGVTYTGPQVGGKLEGNGTAVYEDGRVYIGDFRGGVKEGEGTCQWNDGRRYEGSWLNDEMSGVGVMTWKSGEKYEGNFKNGVREGEGIFYYAEGDASNRVKYEGHWSGDKKNGRGHMAWASGTTYEGEYKDGRKEGSGVMIWQNGQKYEGQFKNDLRNGQGTFYYAEDDERKREKYEGGWLEDEKEGTGSEYWKSGQTYEGEYKNGKREGTGVMTWPSGEVYKGQFKNNQLEGIGTMTWPNGAVYKGEYKNGKREGTGTHYFAKDNKNKYEKFEGQWEDDKYINGIMTLQNGTRKKWRNNKLWD